MNTETRIYVANLGKYNEGELIGEWISLPSSEEQFEEMYVKIKVAHYDENGDFEYGLEENGSFYEEVAIHDYESDIYGFKIGEYDNIEDLNDLMIELQGLQDYELEEIEAILECQGGDLADAIEIQQKGNFTYYSGIDTYEDLAEMLVDEGCFGEVDTNNGLFRYIDFEALGRDLSYDGYSLTKNGVLCMH